jgi:hypothetical protein
VIGLGDQATFRALDEAGLRFETIFRDVPGEEWTIASSDPAAGTQVPLGSVVTLTVASHVTPLPDGAADVLACVPDAHVVFGGPWAVDQPFGETFIRVNLGGLRSDDDLAYVGPGAVSGPWHVIRDGAVIAVVDYDSLDGVACAGSGIAGA